MALNSRYTVGTPLRLFVEAGHASLAAVAVVQVTTCGYNLTRIWVGDAGFAAWLLSDKRGFYSLTRLVVFGGR